MRAFLILITLLFISIPALAETTPATDVETLTPLTETLKVEDLTQSVIHKYEDLLEKTQFRGTIKGNLALTGIVILIAAIATLLARFIPTQLLLLTRRLFTWLHMPYKRIQFYAGVLRIAIIVATALISLYALVYIWEIPEAYNPFHYPAFDDARKIVTNVFVVLALSAFAWEIINTIIQIIFIRTGGENSTRSGTVISVIRNIAFVIFASIFTLILLSEFGINIMPLLAGAGIVGIAVGFGAQTIVKDFLTGFTLIMEDVFRVGDTITIAGITGTVERITLRQVQLRGYTGVISNVPFSSITVVQNLTRDFSAYEINIGVAYNTDTDHAFAVMERVSQTLMDDPTFAPIMLDTLEISGVDKFADSAIMLRARIRTIPGKQWTVGREFNRRMKKAFESEGIEIPFPQQVTYLKNIS